MGLYLVTAGLIFGIMLCGIAVERLYRRFAASNPQLGPYRDTSTCGNCTAGSGCGADPCASDGAEPASTPRH